MSGEKNLANLLKNMEPVLNTGDSVFYRLPNMDKIDQSQLVGSSKEVEGTTPFYHKHMMKIH